LAAREGLGEGLRDQFPGRVWSFRGMRVEIPRRHSDHLVVRHAIWNTSRPMADPSDHQCIGNTHSKSPQNELDLLFGLQSS